MSRYSATEVQRDVDAFDLGFTDGVRLSPNLFSSAAAAADDDSFTDDAGSGGREAFLPVGSRLGTYLRQNVVNCHQLGAVDNAASCSVSSSVAPGAVTPGPGPHLGAGSQSSAGFRLFGSEEPAVAGFSLFGSGGLFSPSPTPKDRRCCSDDLLPPPHLHGASSCPSPVGRRRPPSASSLPFLPQAMTMAMNSRQRPAAAAMISNGAAAVDALVNSFPHLSVSPDRRHQMVVSAARNCNCPDFTGILPQQSPCSNNFCFANGSVIPDFNSRLKDLTSFAGKPAPVSPLSSASWENASVSPVVRETTGFASPKVVQESIGGTTYFYPGTEVKYPCEIRLFPKCYSYTRAPSHLVNFSQHSSPGSGYFVTPAIREELVYRQLAAAVEVDREQYPEPPAEVGCYVNLVPIEPVMRSGSLEKPGYFGLISTVYKAVSVKDGLLYCLRRFHDFQLANKRCVVIAEAWKKIQHTNVVQLRDVFTTTAFGDSSLILVFDYHAGAETLKYRHFSGASCRPRNETAAFPPGGAGCQLSSSDFVCETAGIDHANEPLPEWLLWCYAIDLSSALRTIHSAGLAARTIDPSKILVLGKSRLLVNCCSVFDIVTFDQLHGANSGLIQRYQQDDLFNFGRLILLLASNAVGSAPTESVQTSVDRISQRYSQDLKNLILHLLHGPRARTINDIMPIIGARFFAQLSTAQMRIDMLENELTKEIENGRLLRLLCKLGVVNERFEYETDPKWSETGERYILKLFRSYLFHQVTENRLPWLDLAHVVQCLNKLDAGVSEKLMLLSHDQQSALIVSYADLHRCLNESFNELAEVSAAP